ncbi:protein phosphatase 2C domain-containing protein [Polyangium sp. 15x6]|uniref:protein phosphatase 2C domain-containing protein n=1 Tax=Polyangium sp. 15x6 TaxID=3042687 RepID=UPI00249C9738|nr:protein phosphatase 2C domain-containing protein [Polyangium sp. 15x6]MDI3291655.1 protein phosphatase 2C domain-containing protein [Polyangium sp. 15x6]
MERSRLTCQLFIRSHEPLVALTHAPEKSKLERTVIDADLQNEAPAPVSAPSTDPHRSELRRPLDATLLDNATQPAQHAQQGPPDPPLPRGFSAMCVEPRDPRQRRFGSASHPGPQEIAQDKGNQDFAFHLEVDAKGDAPWVLCGVADGVGQATWSARAARHAAAGFIEAFADFVDHPSFPATLEDLLGDVWHAPLSERIHARILGRIEEDKRLLLKGRFVDPTWAPVNFERMFWSGVDSEERIRSKWFQTTLLAAALGPHGGFAVFLGDGFVRVDRVFEDGRWESSAGLTPTRAISMDLGAAEVAAALTRLPPRGAGRLGVLMTTDGVSNSTQEGLTRAIAGCDVIPGFEARPPLERIHPTDSAECARVVETLALLPPALADRDNMSIAFALCALASEAKR